MAKTNVNSTILTEHRRIVRARHILAVLNFIAVLLSTLVTVFFVNKRGASSGIVVCLYLLIGINVLQVALCIFDYVLKRLFGAYIKALPIISYSVGALWVIVWIIEMVIGSSQIGAMRQDLLIVSIIQLVVALAAYLVWPMLDRSAINAMIRPSVRDDEGKRKSKAKKFVFLYGLMCLTIIVAQAGVLFTYRLPPRLYDIFDASRAIAYELTEDGESYVVKSVYRGTASSVNIPATYNNKPVIGIASGALVEDEVIEKYQITEITFGTPTTTEEGEEITECNLLYIENGAISNDKITKLSLPSSLTRIENGAIESASLTHLQYAAKADFDIAYLQCGALQNILMMGENVGKISSLAGMSQDVVIQVNKDIYNEYRKDNFAYVSSFSPILGNDEFVLDFYTNSNYYVESIFSKIGTPIQLSVEMLDNNNVSGISPKVDTLAYISNNRELGTEGAKASSAFRGWYYDETFADECAFLANDTVEITKNTSLYAKWIPEYTGTLNWGTYKPLNAVDKQYWTDEDTVEFPVVTGRTGYAAGVQWYANKSATPVATSSGISQDVQLNGIWTLDKPEIDIINEIKQPDTLGKDYSENELWFTYDEDNRLRLLAEYEHPLHGAQHNGDETEYAFKWTKQEDVNYLSQDNKIDLINVPQQGHYTLEVTVISPYGETSTQTTDVNVTISKKAISIGSAAMVDASVVYDGESHQLLYSGDFGSDNLSATYRYYKEGALCTLVDNGVVNAGVYNVQAVFEKDNAEEAANYETITLDADLTITQRPLQLVGWKGKGDSHVWAGNSTVYNGRQHEVEMEVSNIVAGDEVRLTYSGNIQTNAGDYIAEVTAISNTNYTLSEILGVARTYSWAIAKKQVSVLRWELNGDNWNAQSVGYDGAAHSVSAVLDGAENGENISFIYSTEEAFVNSATNAGAYQAKIVGVSSDNYYIAPTAENLTFDWQIAKRQLYIEFDSKTLTYDGTEQGLTATISNFVTADLNSFTKDTFVTAGTDGGLTVSEAVKSQAARALYITFTAKNARTYTAVIDSLNVADDLLYNNYEIASSTEKTKTFAIAKKPLTVQKCEDKTYNAAEQELTLKVSGFTSGDAGDINHIVRSNFLGTAAVDMKKNVNSGYVELVYRGTNAGEYTVAVSGIDEINGNYVIPTEYSATVKILPKALSVNKWMVKDLSKSQENQIFEYDAESAIVYNYHGYEIYPSLNGVQGEDEIILSYVNGTVKNAGTYTTTATLPNSYINYTFVGASLPWTLTKKTVEVVWNATSSFVYNGEYQSPTFSLNGLLLADMNENRYISMTSNTGVAKTFKTASGQEYAFTESYGFARNVGTYTLNNYKITKDSTGTTLDENYEIVGEKSFNITKKTVEIVWNEDSFKNVVYNGQYQSPNFKLQGIAESDYDQVSIRMWYNDTNKCATLSVEEDKTYQFIGLDGFAVNAGTYVLSDYQIMKSGGLDGNYTIENNTKSFVIAKKDITLSGEWKYSNAKVGDNQTYYDTGVTYNKNAYTFSTKVGASEGLVEHLLDGLPTITLYYTNGTATNAGEYTVSVQDDTYTNYALTAENRSLTYTILPKVVTPVWSSTTEYTYTGSNLSYTPTCESGEGEGKVCAGDSFSWVFADEDNTTQAKIVGDYKVVVKGTNNPNYVVDTTADVNVHEWKISKRILTQENFGYTNLLTYNGENQKPQVYYGSVTVVGYEETAESVNVGDYVYTIKTLSDSHNYGVEPGTKVSFRINRLAVSIGWKAVNEDVTGAVNTLNSLTYNSKPWTLQATVTNLKSQKGVQDTVNIVYSQPEAINAGNYVAQISNLNNDNYTLDGGINTSVNFTIIAKKLTFEWTYRDDGVVVDYDTKVYNGNPFSATATAVGVCVGDAVTISYNSSNSFTDVVTAYNVAVMGLNNSNYEIDKSSNTYYTPITITKKAVTLDWSANAGEFVYDGQIHVIAPTLSGYVAGQDVGIGAYTVRRDGKAFSGNSIKDAGVYTLKVTSLSGEKAGNYAVPNDQETFTVKINRKTVTLDWSDVNAEYHADKWYTVKPTVVGAVAGGAALYVDSYSRTMNGLTGTQADAFVLHNAGSYVIKALSLNDDVNYVIADNTTKEVTYTISKQALGIRWTTPGDSLEYDGSYKTLSWELYGTKDGATVQAGGISKINAGNNYKTTAEYAGSDYYIPQGLETTKSFSIAQRTISVDWSAYRDGFTYKKNTSYTITPQFVNVVGSDDVGPSYTVKSGNSQSDSNTLQGVGTYKITVAIAHSNYKLDTYAQQPYTVEIRQQSIRIEWTGTTEVTYDGNAHSLTAILYGAEDGLETGTRKTYSATAAGTHAFDIIDDIVNYVVNFDTNYSVKGFEGNREQTLTITPQAVRAVWQYNSTTVSNSASVKYNGRAHTFLAYLYGVNDSANSTRIGIGEYTVSTVGTHTLKADATNISNENYTIVGAENTTLSVTVEKATLNLTWTGVTNREYTKNWQDSIDVSYGLYGNPLDSVDVTFVIEKYEEGVWKTATSYDVGTYRARATALSGADAGNYDLTTSQNVTSNEFTISAAKAYITRWPQTNNEYDAVNVVVKANSVDGVILKQGVDYKVDRVQEIISGDTGGTSVTHKWVVTMLNDNYVLQGTNEHSYN